MSYCCNTEICSVLVKQRTLPILTSMDLQENTGGMDLLIYNIILFGHRYYPELHFESCATHSQFRNTELSCRKICAALAVCCRHMNSGLQPLLKWYPIIYVLKIICNLNIYHVKLMSTVIHKADSLFFHYNKNGQQARSMTTGVCSSCESDGWVRPQEF